MPTPRKYASCAKRQHAYRQRQAATRIAETRAKGLPPPSSVPTMPSKARWRALVLTATDLLKTVEQEMQTYRDDRSESWQDGDKGQLFQERLDLVEQARLSAEALD